MRFLVLILFVTGCATPLEDRLHHCPFTVEDVQENLDLFSGLWAEEFGAEEGGKVSGRMDTVEIYCHYVSLYNNGRRTNAWHRGYITHSEIRLHIAYDAKFSVQSSLFHELTHAGLFAIQWDGGGSHTPEDGWTDRHENLIKTAQEIALQEVFEYENAQTPSP